MPGASIAVSFQVHPNSVRVVAGREEPAYLVRAEAKYEAKKGLDRGLSHGNLLLHGALPLMYYTIDLVMVQDPSVVHHAIGQSQAVTVRTSLPPLGWPAGALVVGPLWACACAAPPLIMSPPYRPKFFIVWLRLPRWVLLVVYCSI